MLESESCDGSAGYRTQFKVLLCNLWPSSVTPTEESEIGAFEVHWSKLKEKLQCNLNLRQSTNQPNHRTESADAVPDIHLGFTKKRKEAVRVN